MPVPKGAILRMTLTQAELDALEARAERRRAPASVTSVSLRSAADEAALDALCAWLADNGLNVIGTISFRPDVAERMGLHTLDRALTVTEAFIKRVHRGNYVLAGEWHPSGRSVPHVHLALACSGDRSQACHDLWRKAFADFGRSRFEPMRDVSRATLYGLKDTIKATTHDATSMRLRLNYRNR